MIHHQRQSNWWKSLMYFRQNWSAPETKPYWEQRRNDEVSQPNHTVCSLFARFLAWRWQPKEGWNSALPHSLEVWPSLLKPQGKGLVITKWQNFSPNVFHMAWKKKLTTELVNLTWQTIRAGCHPGSTAAWVNWSVGRELASIQHMQVQSWDTDEIWWVTTGCMLCKM